MKKILFFVITTLIFVPSFTFAQQYLVGLPIDTKGSFNEYINLLYKMSISIAALLAVVKIIIAGAKYMLSDVVTQKSDAKKDIKGALLGLLLIIGAVIILNTINPALTDGGLNIKKLDKVSATINPPPVAVPPAVTPTPSPAPVPVPPTGTPTPNPTPAPVGGGPRPTPTVCNPAIKTSVSSIYTIFSQNLTGCSAADQVIYRGTLDDLCKTYGAFAAGSSTIRSCGVPTTRI